MKCEYCNLPAWAHAVDVTGLETHYCETHAKQLGVLRPLQQAVFLESVSKLARLATFVKEKNRMPSTREQSRLGFSGNSFVPHSLHRNAEDYLKYLEHVLDFAQCHGCFPEGDEF